jgi:2-polyprenyl-3-methyl-5-hydroxy-6-metoxy-1,4-benzoquinol methylase
VNCRDEEIQGRKVIMKACPICKSTNSDIDRVLNGYRLVKCSGCSFVFADVTRDLIEQVNARHDDQFVDQFEERCQSPFEVAFFRLIAGRYHARFGPGRVLDVGCGTGLLLSFFKELGWDCVGVDLSSWTERYAKRYGFTFHQGRLEDLALAEKSFDLVVSTSTLEHIEDPLPHVREILRVMKPDGAAYFSGIPNYNSFDVLIGVSRFYNNMPPDHPNYFTPRTLRNLFNTSGVRNSDLLVRSYGLYGAHKVYFALKRIMKKHRLEQSSAIKGVETGTSTSEIGTVKQKSWLSFGALLYVMMGRPFGVGSKLEAEVTF